MLTGDGHAPEQMMLYCAADKLFLAADQVLAKISPNVSVWAVDPIGDPLGLYLRSLNDAANAICRRTRWCCPAISCRSTDCTSAATSSIAHHETRCAAIDDACRAAPRSAAELVPVIFHRPLDPHQMSFAFSEVLAHVNYMVREGRLVWTEPLNGIARVVAAA